MKGAKTPSPEYASREGCEDLGGLIALSSPRCFVLRINTVACGGYAEMEGGRQGGTLRRLFVCLGDRRRSTGLTPVRSQRPTIEGCARNWSNGG
jgi:hypothetical protein